MTTSTLKDFTDDVTVHEVVASVSGCQLLHDDLSSLNCYLTGSAKCKALNIE